MTTDIIIFWYGFMVVYFCGFLSTAILVTGRFFSKSKDGPPDPVVIIPISFMSVAWPFFWGIVAYGKLTGKA